MKSRNEMLILFYLIFVNIAMVGQSVLWQTHSISYGILEKNKINGYGIETNIIIKKTEICDIVLGISHKEMKNSDEEAVGFLVRTTPYRSEKSELSLLAFSGFGYVFKSDAALGGLILREKLGIKCFFPFSEALGFVTTVGIEYLYDFDNIITNSQRISLLFGIGLGMR